MRKYRRVWKIVTGQDNDDRTGYLLVFPYFREYYKMIAMDLSRQEAFNFNRKAMQPISFTEILDQAEDTTMFFIIEEAIETILNFTQEIGRAL